MHFLIVIILYRSKLSLDDLEISMVLQEMHERVSGGHLSFKTTIRKILDAKYWWPTMQKCVMKYYQTCDNY